MSENVEIKLLDFDFRQQHIRFNELYDLYTKADGRRQLFFEDKGYVSDVDLFITGCMSSNSVELYLTIDASTLDWKVLSGHEKVKTLIDFYENKIMCQGLFYKDLKPLWLKSRIKDLKIRVHAVNPSSSNEPTRKFLSL